MPRLTCLVGPARSQSNFMVPLLCAEVFQLCVAVLIPEGLFWLSVYVLCLHRLEKIRLAQWNFPFLWVCLGERKKEVE